MPNRPSVLESLPVTTRARAKTLDFDDTSPVNSVNLTRGLPMYSKLYARITESSLMEEPIDVRYTFVLMLAIADPEGYVIGTNIAIARRLNMDIAQFESCLAVLMSPDANSNSKEFEGRRVVVSDGERGYRLVNFVNYRDMKSPQDRRDYMRDYMRRRRVKTSDSSEATEIKDVATSVNISKQPLAQLRHGDGDATDTETEKKARKASEPKVTWLTPFIAEWVRLVKGEPSAGKLAKPLKRLVDAHGTDTVLIHWRNYLEQLDRDGKTEIASAARFSETFGQHAKAGRNGSLFTPKNGRPPNPGDAGGNEDEWANRFEADKAARGAGQEVAGKRAGGRLVNDATGG